MKYACLDAYASVLVYQMIDKLQDPIRGAAPSSSEPVTKVYMQNVWSGLVFLEMNSSATVDRSRSTWSHSHNGWTAVYCTHYLTVTTLKL